MTHFVYLLYAMDCSPHGFTSDWQDHRTFELKNVYDSETKALERKAFLMKRGYSVTIKEIELE